MSGRMASTTRSVPPLVFRVFALEFQFEFWVGFLPKIAEVAGDLDGAMIGGKDLDGEGTAPGCDAEAAIEAVEILDPRREGWWQAGSVGDFCPSTAGEFQTFGCKFFEI